MVIDDRLCDWESDSEGKRGEMVLVVGLWVKIVGNGDAVVVMGVVEVEGRLLGGSSWAELYEAEPKLIPFEGCVVDEDEGLT